MPMTMTTTMTARDQYLVQVEFAASRLRRFRDALPAELERVRAPFEARAAALEERCATLRKQILGWTEVRVGTASAVEDLGGALDTLEADFDASFEAASDEYRSTVDRQLRAWRSRADRLRLQGALAAMEFRDDLDDIGHRLATARAGALLELRTAQQDAKDVVVDLRDDVEDVLIDVRHAVERVADALTNAGHSDDD